MEHLLQLFSQHPPLINIQRILFAIMFKYRFAKKYSIAIILCLTIIKSTSNLIQFCI